MKIFLILMLIVNSVWAVNIDSLRTEMEKGDLDAQYTLGMYYKNLGEMNSKEYAVKNRGVQKDSLVPYELTNEEKKNLVRAELLLRKAAEKEHAGAEYTVALYYIKGGRTIKPNDKKAFQLFEKAANQGHKDAQLFLAIAYLNGYKTDADPKKAVYWLTKASEQGAALAYYHLAICYASGYGVDVDLKKSGYYSDKYNNSK